jgi:hypothetical protein
LMLTAQNRGTCRGTDRIATLSTTNSTRTGPALNPGLRGERPASNRSNHGTVRLKYSALHEGVWGADKYLHLVLTSTLAELSGELHIPTALPLRGKELPIPIVGPRDGLGVLE